MVLSELAAQLHRDHRVHELQKVRRAQIDTDSA